MDILLLYLFTRADDLHYALLVPGWITVVLSTIGIIISSIIAVVDGQEGDREKGEEMRDQCKKALDLGAFLLLLGLLCPTKTDIAIIVGGHLAYEGITSEKFLDGADETSSKIYKLIHKQLDEAIEDDTTQEQKTEKPNSG